MHTQPNEDWSVLDFKLLEAYQMLQDEICKSCGQPIWLCHSSSNNVAFHVKPNMDYGEKALLAAQDMKKPSKERAKSAEKKDWGVSYYLEAYVPPTQVGDLPTRNDYYKQLAEENPTD